MIEAPVDIVIPAFNQLDYCRQCITSILQNTDVPYRLVLVDNGSTDGVGEFFDAVPGAIVVHTGENLGFAGGINRGLAHCDGHAVLLNSDTLVPRGWLGRLVRALEADEYLGMIGPMSNCVSGEQLIEGLAFDTLDAVSAYADALHAQHGDAVRDTARLVGFCLLVRDRVLRDVGTLDERFGIGNFEDDDYGLRVLRAGYRLGIAEGAFVFHYGSRTFAGMGLVDDAWRDLIARNESLFVSKWQGTANLRDEDALRSRAHNRAARAAADAGDDAEALRCLKAAIEACPQLAENHNDLGVVLWRMGEQTRGHAAFARAVRLDPAFAAARDNLRDASAALGLEMETGETA